MADAAGLRAEAKRLRALTLTLTDPEILAESKALIEELERRARELGNGDANDECRSHDRLRS